MLIVFRITFILYINSLILKLQMIWFNDEQLVHSTAKLDRSVGGPKPFLFLVWNLFLQQNFLQIFWN